MLVLVKVMELCCVPLAGDIGSPTVSELNRAISHLLFSLSYENTTSNCQLENRTLPECSNAVYSNVYSFF